MCLSTVYQVENDNNKMVCQYVSNMEISNDSIKLTDITGEEIEIKGIVRSVDLIKNVILVEAAK